MQTIDIGRPGGPEGATAFICARCGTQYAPSRTPPDRCQVCDRTAAAPPAAAAWATPDQLRRQHDNIVQRLEEDLFSVRTIPSFGRGQRAMLVRSPGGNLLWDGTPLVDGATVAIVRALGGVDAIAISHPQHAGAVVEWSRAFGGVPVYAHATAEPWLMRPDPVFRFWSGERVALHDGISLAYAGGQDGTAVLHWPAGSKGMGTLLTGAAIQIVHDPIGRADARVSVLPGVPLALRPAADRRWLLRAVESDAYDRAYDGWDRAIDSNARATIVAAAERSFAPSGRRDAATWARDRLCAGC